MATKNVTTPVLTDKEWEAILTELHLVEFVFYEVTYRFGPERLFSKAQLQLKPVRLANNSVATIAFDTLFDLNLEHLSSGPQVPSKPLMQSSN